MNIVATLYEGDVEPSGYQDRDTVKAVILNDNDEVLLFSGGLPGGGVEVGETNQLALKRELMEEIGATVTIVHELGNVVTYRDEIKKRYVFTGYECRLISLVTPTTTIANEVGLSTEWQKRTETISRMEAYVLDVQTKGRAVYAGDRYQRHLFNTQAALVFLKAIE